MRPGALGQGRLCPAEHKMFYARQMEEGEHRDQQDKQWCNAGKAQQIKIANIDAGKRTPAPERGRSNEKAGDGEENLHAKLTVPNQRGDQLVGETFGVIQMGLHES